MGGCFDRSSGVQLWHRRHHRFLGDIAGGGTYESLITDSVTITVFGVECRCLGLDRLIEVKRAAGRPKDFEAIAELEALRDERQRGK